MTTYTEMPPSTPLELQSSGIFKETGRKADKRRQELAAWTYNKFRDCKQDRWRQERQWYLNLAFYFGQQHVVFRNTANIQGAASYDLYVPNAPYYRVRPVINHTRRIIRKEIARLTAQKPNAFVIPASSEDKDLFAAQAGEQIWDSLYRKNNLTRVIRHTAFWTSVCGNGFIKQFWDESIMDEVNQVPGDVVFKAETPFHVFIPDLRAEDIEDQPYLFHGQLRSPEWVRVNFGVDIMNQAAEPQMIEESLLNVMGANQFNSKDQVLVLEAWVKPQVHPWLPDGGMLTCIGNVIVQGYDQWPYSHKQYPFSKVDNIPTGKFYNESVITDLIPLQRELNRTRGQIIEAKNRMAKPQLAAEMGSVDPTKMTSEPGQVVLYQSGYNPPQPIPLQSLPSYVMEEVNRLLVDMADISGQHEVSQGSVPPGVTAATAISYLQEQDESMLGTVYSSLEEAIEKTAHQTLCYVHDYWDVPRTVKIVGVDGSFDAQVFKGSQIGDNTDIKIESGSSLPTSRAAKQAFIMDLMKMNFIPPQEGLEVMEVGGLNKIYERLQVDVRQAQRENLKMASASEETIELNDMAWMEQHAESNVAIGQPPVPELGPLGMSPLQPPTENVPLEPPLVVPVNTWDNHGIHIEIHNRYRKSQSFEMAPPHVRELFEEHVKQHVEAMMVGMQAQMPPDMQNPLAPGAEVGSPEGAQPAPPGPEPAPQMEGEM